MKPVLIATAVVVGVGAFVAFIIWVIRRQAQLQAAADRAWRAYAARRHLQWNDPSGPWYRRKGYSMVGDIGGTRATFDQFDVSNGKSSVRYYRVSAELARAVPERLLACRKTFFNRLNFAFQGPLVEVNGPASTNQLHVRCRSAQFARSVADSQFRAAFYALPPRAYVECRDRQAKVWWLGAERDPAVLDRASELVLSLVRATAKA